MQDTIQQNSMYVATYELAFVLQFYEITHRNICPSVVILQ